MIILHLALRLIGYRNKCLDWIIVLSCLHIHGRVRRYCRCRGEDANRQQRWARILRMVWLSLPRGVMHDLCEVVRRPMRLPGRGQIAEGAKRDSLCGVVLGLRSMAIPRLRAEPRRHHFL